MDPQELLGGRGESKTKRGVEQEKVVKIKIESLRPRPR
jgi:hypothetical protein